MTRYTEYILTVGDAAQAYDRQETVSAALARMAPDARVALQVGETGTPMHGTAFGVLLWVQWAASPIPDNPDAGDDLFAPDPDWATRAMAGAPDLESLPDWDWPEGFRLGKRIPPEDLIV